MSISLPTDWKVQRLEDTTSSRGSHLCITVPDPQFGTKDIIVPAGITTNPQQLMKVLRDKGARIPAGTKAVDIANAVDQATPEVVGGLLAMTTGWHELGGVTHYVYAAKEAGGSTTIYPDPQLLEDALAVSTHGSLEDWKHSVGEIAKESLFASLTIIIALAGCLLRYSGLSESFIVNLFGESSTGKTTAVKAGASVWGPPDQMGRWLGSHTGLLHAAAANSDGANILDDVEKADFDPKRRPLLVREMIHSFADGSTRKVSRSHRDQLPSLKFRVVTLSSSPTSIRQEAIDSGKPFSFGDTVRLLEVAIPNQQQGGIWYSAESNSFPDHPSHLSKALSDASDAAYGTAGRAMVEYVLRNQDQINAMLANYRSKLRLPQATEGMKVRISDKIAFLFAVGRMARKAGVLDWDKAWIESIFLQMYDAVKATAFGDDDRESRLIGCMNALLNEQDHVPRFSGKEKDFHLPDDVIGAYGKGKKRLYAQRERLFEELGRHSGVVVTPGLQREMLSKLAASGALLTGQGQTPARTVEFANKKLRVLVFDVPALGNFLRAHREE